MKSGPYKRECIDHETWKRMLDEYYRLHGWEVKTRLQRRETLESLDRYTVVDRLAEVGLLK